MFSLFKPWGPGKAGILSDKHCIISISIVYGSKSAYGAKMQEAVGTSDLQKVINLLETASDNTLFNWKNEICFFTINS